MTETDKPDADRQEQNRPGFGDARPSGPPEDAPEADAMEQGDLTPPPADPSGESLEERLQEAEEERSGDEPA